MNDGNMIQRHQIGSLEVNLQILEMIERLRDNDDIDSSASEPEVQQENAIFIKGLPVTMSEQRLFDALSNTFAQIGQIKVITKNTLEIGFKVG
jgi:hypothetical protein